MKRSSILATAFGAIIAASLAANASAQETLTINSFGGSYEETHRALVITPFEKMYNV